MLNSISCTCVPTVIKEEKPKIIYGCTDNTAKNYNKNANQNDGSCIYYKKGCTDVNSINYDENAEVDDGKCIKKVIGCMDNTAKNYNPNANVNENCVYEEKEIDIEEDKESNGLVATLLTLGTVGTSVVLIKKRH